VRSARIIWRHKIMAATIIALGLAGNAVYTFVQPQVFTASTIVVLSPPGAVAARAQAQGPSININTQRVVVTSVPVLSDALGTGHLGFSLDALRSRVQVTAAGALSLYISAQGETARQAETTANAVTRSYINYVSSARNPAGQQPAKLLQPAATAIAKPRSTRVYQAAFLGGLVGAIVAVIVTLTIGRSDRRLRRRDAIADSIGIPVLASVRARAAVDEAKWRELLEHYEPPAADAWLLHRSLSDLGLLKETERGGRSVGVLSLSEDRDALALGPQLAAFAAAQGVPTALVVGEGQNTKALAALRAACGTAEGRNAKNLLLIAGNRDNVIQVSRRSMTVAVDVVDERMPHVADTARADITVLAVTAGAVTAAQLVRVVASASRVGRTITGVLVANPDRDDPTTGRLPQLMRSQQQGMPTRMVGLVTESRP
jgi:capsular polysaccharide biosynthesis protein